MATSAARKAAPARKSPAARTRRTAAAPKATRAASKPPAVEAAAPLNLAKAAVEPAPQAKAAEPKQAKPKQAKPNGEADTKKSRADGAAEAKKLKLVRDSFTLPKVEYGVIGVLKTRAARLGHPARKSEIVRAGVRALAEMDDAQFLACVSSLPAAKPPRGKT